MLHGEGMNAPLSQPPPTPKKHSTISSRSDKTISIFTHHNESQNTFIYSIVPNTIFIHWATPTNEDLQLVQLVQLLDPLPSPPLPSPPLPLVKKKKKSQNWPHRKCAAVISATLCHTQPCSEPVIYLQPYY